MAYTYVNNNNKIIVKTIVMVLVKKILLIMIRIEINLKALYIGSQIN